jgi:hypothetical protein
VIAKAFLIAKSPSQLDQESANNFLAHENVENPST